MRAFTLTTACFTVIGVAFASASTLEFHQFGTASDDFVFDIAFAPSGASIVGGATDANLNGRSDRDAFVANFNAFGDLSWRTQFGTSQNDSVNGVAADNSGNTFVTGTTFGEIGQNAFGGADAFLTKLNEQGEAVWTDQFGTSGVDTGSKVQVDSSGNAFTSGRMAMESRGVEPYLAKHDADGNRLWLQTFGTQSDDVSFDMDLDRDGNVYITGTTNGDFAMQNIGVSDAFVAKFDTAGNEIWRHQFGSSNSDNGFGIAVDENQNVFVAGSSRGTFENRLTNDDLPGGINMFVTKLDRTGETQWARQFGTAEIDEATDVVLQNDTVTVVGRTDGALFGDHNGLSDIAFLQLSSSGYILNSLQSGSPQNDAGNIRAAIDPESGGLFFAGWTDGLLGQQAFGGSDAFTGRLIVPEPNGFQYIVVLFPAFLRRRLPYRKTRRDRDNQIGPVLGCKAEQGTAIKR